MRITEKDLRRCLIAYALTAVSLVWHLEFQQLHEGVAATIPIITLAGAFASMAGGTSGGGFVGGM